MTEISPDEVADESSSASPEDDTAPLEKSVLKPSEGSNSDDEIDSELGELAESETHPDEEEVEFVESLPDGPEEEGWNPIVGEVPKEPITEVLALGDLHGWAPGLITYLTENQLAKIEVNGKKLYKKGRHSVLKVHADNMREVFPEPVGYYKTKGDKVHFPSSGLLGLDTGSGAWRFGHHSIKAVWIGDLIDPGLAFVQIGDVFDRSDHNEVASEILRQLVIQAPLRVFVLAGNHEQFMLEGDRENWLFNESRWSFSEEHLRPPARGFHTRFHGPTYGWSPYEVDASASVVFRMYQASCAALYLTQACAIAKATGGDYPIGLDAELILSGGFSSYKESLAHLDKLLALPRGNLPEFPGAIVTLGIGHALFAHAEPAAFETSMFHEVVKHRTLKENKTEVLLSDYRISGGVLDASPDFGILWSRNSSHGSTSHPPSPSVSEHIDNLVKDLPGLRHYVHGHTPVGGVGWFEEVSGSCIVNYLARRHGTPPSRSKGSVRIHMIDEGICPVYYQGPADIFDPARVPLGLLKHNSLNTFHGENSESIELEVDEQDWWQKVATSKEGSPFSVPDRLVLLEPTNIGAFSEGRIAWPELEPWTTSYQLPDGIGFDGYRVISQDYSAINDGALSLLLYPTDSKLLQQPQKIPIKSDSRGDLNASIDSELLDALCSYAGAVLSSGLRSDTFQNYADSDWLEHVNQDYVERLNPHLEAVKQHGLHSLLRHAKCVFVHLFNDSKGVAHLIIMNGTEKTVHAFVGRLDRSKKKGEKTSAKAGNWSLTRIDGKSKANLLQLTISGNSRAKLPFSDGAEFKSSDADGVTEQALSGTRGLSVVCWLGSANSKFAKLPKSNGGKLPIWKIEIPEKLSKATTIITDTEPESLPPPPPPAPTRRTPPPPGPLPESPPHHSEPSPTEDSGVPWKKPPAPKPALTYRVKEKKRAKTKTVKVKSPPSSSSSDNEQHKSTQGRPLKSDDKSETESPVKPKSPITQDSSSPKKAEKGWAERVIEYVIPPLVYTKKNNGVQDIPHARSASRHDWYCMITRFVLIDPKNTRWTTTVNVKDKVPIWNHKHSAKGVWKLLEGTNGLSVDLTANRMNSLPGPLFTLTHSFDDPDEFLTWDCIGHDSNYSIYQPNDVYDGPMKGWVVEVHYSIYLKVSS